MDANDSRQPRKTPASPARREALRAGCRLALAVAGLGLSWPSRAQMQARRVLMVQSFGRDIAPYDAVTSVFRRELARQSAQPIVFLEAALDAGRDIDADEETTFVAYLGERFANPRPDLIVSVGPPAARFVVRHHDAFLPGVPMLLSAVDARFFSKAALRPGDAAVTTAVDLPLAFDSLLAVLPRTRTIAIVLGTTPLERYWRKEAEQRLAKFAQRLDFVWLDGLSLPQMKARVSALPPNSAVFYGLLIADGAGVPHERFEALADLRRSSTAPIFSLFENEIGQGVIGGPYLSQSRAGLATAQAALRILSASTPADPPPVIETMGMERPVYDWRELRRWNIDESRLPPGSEVRFREPSAWERYRKEVITAGAIITLQAALITALLVQRERRRRAEQAAHALGGRLITAYEDEGRRLARELHDDITQRLAGVSIEAAMLPRLADPAARQATELSISGELAHLSRDVHALSYRLHPSVIDDLGLSEALRAECERAARRGGVEVAFEGDPQADAQRGDRALCLFRVAQEALRNAVRHAQARQVRVELRDEDGGTSVKVQDDGVGFDATAARARASLGLASMRERVGLLGGRLAIRSRRGEGTSVSAWVPAEAAA